MTSKHPDGEPWQWSEPTWRRIVGRARAGRSMKPKAWPDGARCAVAISFDADHETIPLRDADESPMRISQGQYGNRQAMPRIRGCWKGGDPGQLLLSRGIGIAASRGSACVADDGHEIGIHSWIHEANTSLPRKAERDLTFRAAETLAKHRRPRAGRHAHRELGFLGQHAGHHPRNGTAVRQLADGRR